MRRLSKRLVRPTITLVAIGLIVVFARRIDWAVTWDAIRSADPTLLAVATVVNLGSALTKAIRWWIFLRAIGSPSLGLAVRATFAGLGLNNILLANGGDAARVVFVARSVHLPSASVLATVALERLFELVGYIAFLALAVTLLDLPPALEQTRIYAIVAVVGMGALLIYLVRRPALTADLAAEVTAPAPEGLLKRARSYGTRFLSTLGGVSSTTRFVAATALSIVGWLLQVATYQLTARAAQFPIPVVATIAAILAVNIGFALRATPGNVGVFQVMYAAAAAAFGLGSEQAVAVALLIQAQQILPVTALGIAAAPHFVFRRRQGRRESDPTDEIPFESRGDEGPQGG